MSIINISNTSNLQKVDDEFRQLTFEQSISDLLESVESSTSTILSVNTVLGANGKMRDANVTQKY